MTTTDRYYKNHMEVDDFAFFVDDVEKTFVAFVKKNKGSINRQILNRISSIQRKMNNLLVVLEEY